MGGSSSSAREAIFDWFEERWRTFDFRNLGSISNLWTIGAGSVFAVAIPLVLMHMYLGVPQAVVNIAFWPLLIVMWVIAILAVGSNGVPQCRACGARLRSGHYTCRKCTSVSAPKVMR